MTVTTAHRRHFSASRGHDSKVKKGSGTPSNPRRYKWVSRPVSSDVYALLESHILDSSRRAAERFPVAPAELDFEPLKNLPDTLNPNNPDNQTPPPASDPDDPRTRKTYAALAIDCEMVAMKGREQGLVRIGVVDFFTGKIVLNSIVRPSGPVTDWRKDVTGFNKDRMMMATRKGKVLSGWEAVREKIFDVTSSETIFVGHALANDLRVLRIATDRVVDSMVMMSRAACGDVPKFPRNWGLKTACQELLNVAVQEKHRPHNAIEDAFATRELVLQCVLNPDKLADWAARTRVQLDEIAQKEMAKEEARKERKARRKAEKAKKTPEQLVQEAAKTAKLKEERKMAKKAKRKAVKEQRKFMQAETKARKMAKRQQREAEARERKLRAAEEK